MRRFLLLAALVAATILAWQFWPYQSVRFTKASFFVKRFSRPYGMAPAAFDGFVRACNRANIHPDRIGQTIGNHPLSVGYHRRDGVVSFRGQKIDYCAALDLGTSDLTRVQLARLLESLAAQGFASFYREGGKWRGREHIHAIYAPLPMKGQLQSQVREWERKRHREKKRRYEWQTRWRHRWR